MAARDDDEVQILRLDSAWNEAYQVHDRAPLADILADDFTGLTPAGEAITKAGLMIDPPQRARSVEFSEQSVQVFGDAAISRGRLQLELPDRRLDQRFLRVFARRDGVWQAVSVSVTPLTPAQPRLYGDLAPWYPLIDPARDHADEAAAYQGALEGAASPPLRTLLELGAGAGNNAFHLKARFRCTLTDPSEAMLALSRQANPECEHIAGDMRTLRLGRQFDAVLVHDAVTYMTREDELRAAVRTAFIHTRPGGAAVFAPDAFRETFSESVATFEGGDGDRALRGLEWAWDPDPADDTMVTEYLFLLRQGAAVTAVHDRHVEGLFSTATWRRILSDVGYRVDTFQRPLDDEGAIDEVFICRRPR